MMALSSCQKCRGFVPPASAACVHCGAPMAEAAPRGGVLLKGLLGVAGAGVAAITLMACYGMPPCDAPPPEGSNDPYHCYDLEPCVRDLPDGGSEAYSCDGTIGGDAGTQPADAGVDAGH
ncbi:hypothetical protein [Archangium lipolyticum]|uniref:hypothetical protein n=1 Tax=Archangium lipolyticum TaxID=2970465 RepID=UPI00214A5871|nr:hypothetical protein [Archangium lipolyticum]